MTVQEIAIHGRTPTTSAMAHIVVDATEYMLLTCGTSVNVIAGSTWIRNGRTLGKCFWDVANIGAHYKKHGSILLDYATRLLEMAQ